MANNTFRRQITQLNESDLSNADNANRPHLELQQNILYLYSNLLHSASRFVTSPEHFYVNSTTGDDTNDGSESNPFATIERATEEIERIVIDTQAVIHVEGGMTYSPTSSLNLTLPRPFGTSGNTIGVILRAENGTVTVDNANSIGNFFTLKNGLLLLSGSWDIDGFNKGIETQYANLILREDTDLQLSNNSIGLLLSEKSACLVNDAKLRGTTNNVSVLVENQSFLQAENECEFGEIGLSGDSRFVWNGQGTLTANDDTTLDAALSAKKSSLQLTGIDADNTIDIGFESDSKDKERIHIFNNGHGEIEYVSTSPVPSGGDSYAITVEKTSSIQIEPYIYFTTQDGRGVWVTCSASWNGGEQLSDRFNNGGYSISYRDWTCDYTAPEAAKYTISVDAGANGKITPSGEIKVESGNDKTFSITADYGYEVDDVLVDGVSQGQITSYTFTNVSQNHQIQASFKQTSTFKLFHPFTVSNYKTLWSSLPVDAGAPESTTVDVDLGWTTVSLYQKKGNYDISTISAIPSDVEYIQIRLHLTHAVGASYDSKVGFDVSIDGTTYTRLAIDYQETYGGVAEARVGGDFTIELSSSQIFYYRILYNTPANIFASSCKVIGFWR